MKKCPKCNSDCEDNTKFCQNCGNEFIIEESANSLDETSLCESIKKKYNIKALQIGNLIFAIIGISFIIIIFVFLFKEVMFRMDYDLSELSQAGIDVLRETTGNSYNILLIVMGLIFNVVLLIIQTVIQVVIAKSLNTSAKNVAKELAPIKLFKK